ncbi:alpha-L-fucosidase, partial [Bacillus toyonensis]|nr:alpha-L-fucosidase [Bacillus toyonensis]
MMRQQWFGEARFGLFVHFGLYSGAARHEWVQNYERLGAEEYQAYFDHFDPDLFDARALARRAKDTSMGYVVLTTKHHEGFCLWESALTDYTSVKACGRDLVREYVDALREEGLRVGLYYSLIDWHHPDFTVDGNHPRRGDDAERERNAHRDMDRYREYLHGQVRELLTGYGEIDYLFFDFTYPEEQGGWAGKGPEDWGAEELLALC